MVSSKRFGRQKREQAVFIELDDFDDCIEEKDDADFLTD